MSIRSAHVWLYVLLPQHGWYGVWLELAVCGAARVPWQAAGHSTAVPRRIWNTGVILDAAGSAAAAAVGARDDEMCA